MITNPLFPLILCTCWFYVLTDPIFQLILCSRWAWRHILKGKADGVHLKNHLLRRGRFSRFSDGIWQDMIRKVIKLYRPTELLLWVPWSIHGSRKSQEHTLEFFQETHWSYVFTEPMCLVILRSHWSYVTIDATSPLILCFHLCYVPSDPMYPRMLFSYWSYVPTDSMFSQILRSYCFCVFPLILPVY